MIACPTCQAMLRLPPGSEMVRCPRCKTVLAVESAPTAEAPPPAAPRPALPLPFDRPAGPVEPAAAAPPPPVAAPVARATVRGKLVREDDPAEDLAREEREKDRRRKAEDQEELTRVLEPLARVCRPARVGVTFMAYGALASCAAAVFFFFYSVTTLFVPGGVPTILWLAGAILAVHWLLTVTGFGFCIAGPRPMRPMAVAGVILMVIHAGVFVPLFSVMAVLVSLDEVGLSGTGLRGPISSALLLSNIFNNLTTVTDLPIYLLSEGLVKPAVLILPVIGGALEFAKLSLIGILTNHYAVEGKDPEVGHLSLRFVYRIFWMLIALVVMKLGLWLIVKITASDPLIQAWFAIPVWMMTNGYFLWWAFAWIALFHTLRDVAEIVTPQRFADKRDRLEPLY
jgi:LSD1 subclass zinc finger protein